ncbi:NPP1 family protein [Pseudoalteromonas sp. MMG013]|nr:NPP1 family protein [Pseudoalteromonas sp. MMG013]
MTTLLKPHTLTNTFFLFPLAFLMSPISIANDFVALAEALPEDYVINNTEPVFDFDTDGCLPSSGISQEGIKNTGLKTSQGLGTNCRALSFLNTSNTFHRYACHETVNGKFCGHFYALYFKKDQIFPFFGGGHRHDWEYAAIWTHDSVVTHGSYSAHGKLVTKIANELPFENGHLKIVYHKDGILTHALRFAKNTEYAENEYNRFVTPPIVSWYEIQSDGLDNTAFRERLNRFDYGSATLPIKDSRFLTNLNKFKPAHYPDFAQSDLN